MNALRDMDYGGKVSLTMTMRYAHLAPDHLQEAKAFNPLARL